MSTASNAVNGIAAFLIYLGGAVEAIAFSTAFLKIPNLTAPLAFGTPPAASLLVSAQASIVITLPSLRVLVYRAPLPPSSLAASTRGPPRHPDIRPG